MDDSVDDFTREREMKDGWFDKIFMVTMLVTLWVWVVILVMLIFNACGVWG